MTSASDILPLVSSQKLNSKTLNLPLALVRKLAHEVFPPLKSLVNAATQNGRESCAVATLNTILLLTQSNAAVKRNECGRGEQGPGHYCYFLCMET